MKGHRKEYRGLLYKDFMNLRSSFVVLGVLTIILWAIFAASDSYFPIFFILMMSASLLVLSSMAQDSEANWNTFVLTTAVSRKDVVRSKYLLMIYISIITWIIGGLLCIYLFIGLATDWLEFSIPALLLISIAAGLLHGSIMIPLKFKVDSPAIHYVSIILIVLLAMLAAVPYYFMIDALFAGIFIEVAAAMVLGLFAASIIAFGISYLISKKIFAKKEF